MNRATKIIFGLIWGTIVGFAVFSGWVCLLDKLLLNGGLDIDSISDAFSLAKELLYGIFHIRELDLNDICLVVMFGSPLLSGAPIGLVSGIKADSVWPVIFAPFLTIPLAIPAFFASGLIAMLAPVPELALLLFILFVLFEIIIASGGDDGWIIFFHK